MLTHNSMTTHKRCPSTGHNVAPCCSDSYKTMLWLVGFALGRHSIYGHVLSLWLVMCVYVCVVCACVCVCVCVCMYPYLWHSDLPSICPNDKMGVANKPITEHHTPMTNVTPYPTKPNGHIFRGHSGVSHLWQY